MVTVQKSEGSMSPRPTYQKVYLSEGLEVRKFISSISPHVHGISLWYLSEINFI